MSVVRFSNPSNTLRKALQTARPAMAQQAIERANANLSKLKDECEAYIDSLLLQLVETAKTPTENEMERLAAIYQVAIRFIGVASLAGLTELENAARSLCDVADGLLERGIYEEEPIRVHVESMRLLRHAVQLGAERNALIAGLRKVRARFAPPVPGSGTA
jgi:glutamine synthetase adenylyltransferase